MMFKITRSKVCMALVVAFCVLAVAFAAIVLPRGAALAEEAKVTFDLTESDFADYDGTGEENRLWLLQTDDAAVALGDKPRYTVAVSADKTAIEGELYNSYAYYNGKAQTVVLNENYMVNGKPLGEYFSFDGAVVYVDESNTATGKLNTENEITTTVRLYLSADWDVADNGNLTYDEAEEAWYLQLEKVWYIVTLNNAIRTYNGDAEVAVDGWIYGADVSQLDPFRPEHGDTAVFEIGNVGYSEGGATVNDVSARFAVKYGESVSYYEVKLEDNGYILDQTKPLVDNYYSTVLAKLGAGSHTLTVLAPDYTAESARTNWWDDTVEVVGAVYTAAPRTIGFAIDPYVLPDKLTDDSDITIEVVDGEVAFNNSKNNVPEVLVKFRGVTLENGVDYMLTSDDVNVGAASFNFVGYGNFDGTILNAGEYTIVRGVNGWKSMPNIMQWTYGNYDKQINRITAEPLYDFKSNSGLWFTITTDKLGRNIASPLLEKITLDSDGYVSNSVAVALSQLKVGNYYLSATVDEHSNYYELSAYGIEFRVFKGLNAWEITPTIKTWTEGEYTVENMPVAKAVFGMALVTVKDSDGKIVYSTASAINDLGSAGAGQYTLTAYVLGTDDYIGMDLYTVVFQIYEKPGMPLWGTLLIVFGVLLIIALVIFILWKKGVFRILTDSIMVSISTKAAVDATIAAVQANKKNEEAKQRAAAERRKEARRNANKKKKEMPLEQQAAELEDKAKKAAERAERMKAKSEAIQLRAERMKELADKQAAEAAEAAAAAAEAEQALEAEAAAAEKATAETPEAEAPTMETPVTETPVAEEPKAEQPTEEATTEEPTAQEPEAEATATENN